MTDNVKVDVKLTKNSDGIYDLTIGDDGDFDSCYGFDTAIIISLFCEQQASAAEVPDAMRRRGWLGNENNPVPGFEIGSKLWLNYQTRNNNTTRNALVDAASDSLQWFVPQYLKAVRCTGLLTTNGVQLEIEAERYIGKVDKLYFNLWEMTGL